MTKKTVEGEVVSSKPVPMKNAKPKKTPKSKQVKDAAPNAWVEKYRAGTIGRQIAEAIAAGNLTNEQILEAVKKERKDAKTTYGCIAWYRSAARKAGVIK